MSQSNRRYSKISCKGYRKQHLSNQKPKRLTNIQIVAKMSEKQSQDAVVTFGGSCSCGRMTYACTDFPKDTLLCHCVSCRKLSGAAYQVFLDVDSKKVMFYDNQEQLKYEGLPKDSIGGIIFLRLSKVGERAHCASCHTPLAMRYGHEPELTHLTLGTVDGHTIKDPKAKEALKPSGQIFTSQRTWWHDPEKSGLRCIERFSGTFEQDMKAWEGKQG